MSVAVGVLLPGAAVWAAAPADEPVRCNPSANPPTCVTDTAASGKPSKKCPCPLREEGEGEGEGEPEFGRRTHAATTAGRYLRHLVPLGAAGLVIAFAVPGRASRRRGKSILLGACAALAVGNYTDFGRWPHGSYVNSWEFFHYYLGSRYAPELGYTELYAAALVADVETGRKFAHPKDSVRDLSNAECIPLRAVLERREEIVARFTTDRWAAFKDDVRHFKGELSRARWDAIFHDKGYNATPVWTMFVGRLTNGIDTSRPGGLMALSLLDPLLMLIAVVAVWRSFDVRTALLMIVLIGTHMTMSHTHMKGALLRTDWVMSLVLAVCALKANRPVLGGAFAAYAAAARVFPAFFAIGLLAIPMISWFRRADATHSGATGPGAPGSASAGVSLRITAGFVVTLALLLAASLVVVGPGYMQQFAVKIWQHNDSFSPWRVGFKHLFLGAYEYRADATHQEVFRQSWLPWWAIQAAVITGFVYLARRLKPWEALAFGFVPTFFLVAPTYYYYMMLVMPLLFFAGRLPRPECTAGLVWLLASSSIAYLIYDAVGRELPLFYGLSLMILATCVLMGISAGLQAAEVARGWCRYPAWPVRAGFLRVRFATR